MLLPRSVADESVRATGALTRLAPHPHGKPAWLEYHALFLGRYGIGAAVPVTELVNPDTGLGFPAGYRGSLLNRPASRLTERDIALLTLAQEAATARRAGVTLDDAAITRLEVGSPAQPSWQPHTELSVQLQAPDRAAVDEGSFDLVVNGAFRAAGTTTGRFLDVLDAADRNRIASEYERLPAITNGALRAQVSCPPLYPQTENVARVKQILANIVSIGEHRAPADHLIPVEDLLVTGDELRLLLWSRSRARPVEPEVFSAVEFANFTHPLARFLCEISAARAAGCGPFSWGAANGLPFLPRLRYGRVILSPARWSLASNTLPGADVPWPVFEARLAQWRQHMMVPDAVYLGAGDQRLPLDLTEPAHIYLLRTHLDRHGRAVLGEAPAPGSLGWIDGRTDEIIIPLAVTNTTAPPQNPAPTAPVTLSSTTAGHIPGASTWVYCKLYGHPARHTSIITEHLPGLLGELEEPVQWWFLPYRDPGDHLRLRFQFPSVGAASAAIVRVGLWTAGLRRLGLVTRMQLDTYQAETGRFGNGAAMAAAETAFADSAAAAAQRAHAAAGGTADARALTAASLVSLSIAFTGGTAAAMAWLAAHVPASSGPAAPRGVRDQAIFLADPHDGWAAVRSLPGGNPIAAAWEQRGATLSAYRATLAEANGPAPDPVLLSLLHLHHVRVSGLEPECERSCLGLARAAAVSWIAQNRPRQ